MIEVAKVISVKNNIARVQIINEDNCGTGCASCKGCSVISPTLVEVDNKVGAKVGQSVKIERNTGAYLQSMGVVFIIPLIMLFIGVGLGYGLYGVLGFNISKDLLSIILGVAFWIISYLIIGLIDKKSKLASKVEFKIVGFQ